MNETIEELISEIAVKHGISVSRDDPILILQTLNARLLNDSAKVQKNQLDDQKQELEAMSLRWGNDIRDKSERLLNAALTASREAALSLIQESAIGATAAGRAEIENAVVMVRRELRQSRTVALMNMLAACITMLAAIVVVWSAHAPG